MTKKNDEQQVVEIDRSRVVVGIPKERNIHQDTFSHFIEIARRGWDFLHLPYCRNDIARNKFAAAALEGGYDWLVMLDSDHKHDPMIVERLLRWPQQDPDVRVVGGLNFRRGEPYDPCAFIIGDDGQTYSMVDWEQGLIEVHALGTGSILIHTSVFEEIDFPWFRYDYNSVYGPDDTYPGVDIWFSRLVREAGIKMFVDTTTTSPHHFNNWITEQTYRSYMQAHKERVANSVGYNQVLGKSGGTPQQVESIGSETEAEIRKLLGDSGKILELGSGEGTDRLAEHYEMHSVEHDKGWLDKYDSHYIFASITPNGQRDWYDAGLLAKELPLVGEYDLLLVDGPPGYVGRLGMLEHLDLFDLSVPVVVDDVHRSAEHYLMEQIAEEAGRDYRVVRDGDKAVGIIE